MEVRHVSPLAASVKVSWLGREGRVFANLAQGTRMSSSKEADHQPTSEAARSGPSPRRASGPILLAGLLLVLAVAGGIVAYQQFSGNGGTKPAGFVPKSEAPEWLEDARQHLRLIPTVETPESREQHARDAERLLKKYLDEQPASPEGARVLLAAAQLVLGTAIDPIQESELKQVETGDLNTAAKIAFGTRRFAEADLLISEALTRDDARAETVRTAVLIRMDLGRDEEVLQHIDELVKLEPDDPRPWEVKGLVYERQGGHWDQAIEAYKKYLEIQPKGAPHVRLRLADQLLTQGVAREAREQLEQVIAEDPQLVEQNPILVGRLIHLEGNSAGALKVAEQTLKTNPKDPSALLLKAQIVFAQGQFAEAIDVLKTTVQVDPMNTEAHYLLGQAYARNGDADKAKEQIERHRKVLDTKIELYRLERRAARDANDAAVRQELARRYEEIGASEAAAFWRREAGQNKPNDESPRK